ncbi:UNVERIFIED_CONTAM: Retrovirus-related Pol polyprotein from transposon RE1 [Sesamum radiatum]|uniref:Retrovirus-related Pol polyprotein from transposon RE1 n=1 Tax=Sesamum radiatum TaxID=300843 RepID=A0AAW2KAR1_SESRA
MLEATWEPPRIKKEGDRKEVHAKAHFTHSDTSEVQAQSASDIKGLSKEEIERLKSIMNFLEGSGGSSCSLAQTGKTSISHALNASLTLPSSSWVVDSGATDHMTTSHHSFITYDACPSNRKVKVAEGSLATVAGQGTVPLFTDFFLKDVLHVPRFSANLLSIKKVTKVLNGLAIFYPTCYVFQDWITGR